MEEFCDVAQAQDFIVAGRHRLRQGRARAGARRLQGASRSWAACRATSGSRRSSSCAASSPQQIYNFLQHEHPQTIALILALPADRVARRPCIGMLPEELQSRGRDAHRRDGPHAPEVIREVEQVMERKLSSRDQPGPRRGRRRQAARRHPQLRRPRRPSGTSSTRSTSATRSSPRTCASSCSSSRTCCCSTTARSSSCSRRSRCKDVALALKGASEEVREKIFGNMSSRAAQMLREDMEFMGPVSAAASIEEAQGQHRAVVRRLEEAGKIDDPARRAAPTTSSSPEPPRAERADHRPRAGRGQPPRAPSPRPRQPARRGPAGPRRAGAEAHLAGLNQFLERRTRAGRRADRRRARAGRGDRPGRARAGLRGRLREASPRPRRPPSSGCRPSTTSREVARVRARLACERDLVELAFADRREGRAAGVEREPDAARRRARGALRKAFVPRRPDGLSATRRPERLSGRQRRRSHAGRGSLRTSSCHAATAAHARGGRRRAHDAGDIDATVESQLERLAKVLFA